VLHFDGIAHRFTVEENAPTCFRVLRSRDLREWKRAEVSLPAAADLGPVSSIGLLQWSLSVVAAVTHRDGVRIWESQRLDEWTEVGVREEAAVCAVPHFNANIFNATRFAEGCVLFLVPAADRRRLLCRWGPAWRDLSAGVREAAAAPPGTEFDDATMAPVFGQAVFALVADVSAGGASRPMYSLSEDSAAYSEPLVPLRFSTPTPPRRLRVYARGENYWMVGYLRRVHGQDRFFWGRIDWDRKRVEISEIDSARALRSAFFVLGIR
jgi:hypothetical protein